MSNSVSQWFSSGQWESDLTAAGFTRGRGQRRYSLDGVTFGMDADWPVLWAESGEGPADPLSGQLACPGLWKWVVEQGRARQVFEIPPAAFNGTAPMDDGNEEWSPFRWIIDWAMATRHGRYPDGWSSPPEEEVAAAIPTSGLTLQHGAFLCQGRLEHDPERLALSIPIVHEIPADLSPERHSWLRCLLGDAQNRWRLVRVGFDQERSGMSVSAGIDLTGVPRPMLEPLVSIALPALRGVAEWVVCSTVFLTMSSNGCRALAAGAVRPDTHP